MRTEAGLVLMLAALAAMGGPLILGLAGLVGRKREPAPGPRARGGWNWRLIAASALSCALAFNLIFFVQELLLVLPKALVPGLEPVLYHNNHSWTGEHPIARLFQGTGALAILLVGSAATLWLRRPAGGSVTLRLFVTWIAYNGLFMSLPQVVAGAVLPQNDVGMAMDYLGLGPGAMLALALAALGAMAAAGAWLARAFLALANDPAHAETRAGRTRFVFQIAVLPGLAAIALILPFRVPGSIDQVAIVPVAVMLIGLAWVQAAAWRATRPLPAGGHGDPSIRTPAVALAVLFAIFQLLLRPGVPFG